MNVLTLTLLLTGLAIISGLACYAWKLWQSVRVQDAATAQRIARTQSDIVGSVRALAKSMLAGELNLSEGAIRLKVMLDHLQPNGQGENAYPDLYALHDATEHMPRGVARKQVSSSEIKRMDDERERLETQYRERVLNQTQALLDAYSR